MRSLRRKLDCEGVPSTCRLGQGTGQVLSVSGRQAGVVWVYVPSSALLLTVALEGIWYLKEQTDSVRMRRWEQH